MLVFALACGLSTQSLAQDHYKTPGSKLELKSNSDANTLQPAETGSSGRLDPKIAHQKRGATASDPSANTNRSKCAVVKKENPYSIKRTDFDKLPADRQRFILENTTKYTIID